MSLFRFNFQDNSAIILSLISQNLLISCSIWRNQKLWTYTRAHFWEFNSHRNSQKYLKFPLKKSLEITADLYKFRCFYVMYATNNASNNALNIFGSSASTRTSNKCSKETNLQRQWKLSELLTPTQAQSSKNKTYMQLTINV